MVGVTYNEIVYLISKAGLNRIPDSVVSISFKVESNNLLVQILVLENCPKSEMKVIESFMSDIKQRVDGYNTTIETNFVSISDFKKYNFKLLDKVFFLRSQDDF